MRKDDYELLKIDSRIYREKKFISILIRAGVPIEYIDINAYNLYKSKIYVHNKNDFNKMRCYQWYDDRNIINAITFYNLPKNLIHNNYISHRELIDK